MARQFSSRGLSAACFLLAIGGLATPTPPSCRYLPGDEGWPSPTDWATLNTTVNGRLIATIPQGSVCHTGPYSSYDEAACKALADGWDSAETFEPHPAEMMNAYYQNQSCDPFTPSTRPCKLGNYASYSISVSSAEDVVAGFQFAKAKNVRLVVKTTGHDYTGRSSGQGALSLWTWNLKSTTVLPQYKSDWYSGPAIKLGSGVIVGEAYAAAHAAGYRIVGGECGSVGIASGYTQGGGHSMLNTEYGMAADQVLEWEVITPTGKHLIATPRENRDLYWALSGGGGGTYGVVLSMTAKIYPESPMAGGSLVFPNTNSSAYWEAVSQWFQQSPSFLGAQNNIIFLVLDNAFEALAITLPNQNETAVHTLLSGYLATLDKLGVQYQLKTTYFNSYYDHFNAYFGPLPYGPNNPTTILMNRIVPKAVTSSPEGAARLTDAWRSTVAGGDFLVGCSLMNVAKKNYTNNAVLPAWRDTNIACNVNAYWNYTAPLEQNLALKRRLSEVHMPVIEAATPGGGIYLNEMDPFYRGDWKQNLFGVNYDRLLSIKHKNDPSHLLWGNFSVASDEMFLDGSGRLCLV